MTLICKELGQLEEIGELAERACVMYQQHGSPDSGALCLEKAAKMIEQQYPDKAVELYRRGVDVVLVCGTLGSPTRRHILCLLFSFLFV